MDDWTLVSTAFIPQLWMEQAASNNGLGSPMQAEDSSYNGSERVCVIYLKLNNDSSSSKTRLRFASIYHAASINNINNSNRMCVSRPHPSCISHHTSQLSICTHFPTLGPMLYKHASSVPSLSLSLPSPTSKPPLCKLPNLLVHLLVDGAVRHARHAFFAGYFVDACG